MKALVAVLCCLTLAAPAYAQDKKEAKKAPEKKEQSAAQKKQQMRMKDCNQQAGERKGDERKKFMSSCLKGDTTAKGEKMTEQQSRMRDCNRQAGDKGFKGDERKKFMSSCLKG